VLAISNLQKLNRLNINTQYSRGFFQSSSKQFNSQEDTVSFGTRFGDFPRTGIQGVLLLKNALE
jgi:hypothetical protein